MFSVRVQTEPISLAPTSGELRDRCGAEVRFVGKVRNDARSANLSHLLLEHFPGVTESEIERIVGQARERWDLQKAQVVHRVGRINVGEDIVVVETASTHRRDAYEANAFIMDYLKTEAPFWKQECFVDGSSHWVEARDSDQLAAQRWRRKHGRRIGALILAGGEGSRMGYVNKGLQALNGRPLVQHVADILTPYVQYVAISANQDLDAYRSLGFDVFPDEPAFKVKGPLAGILGALPQFPDDLDAMLVVPCDTPQLPADLVPRLADALFAAEAPRAVVAGTDVRTHHSVLMCRPGAVLRLVPHLQSLTDPREHSLRNWLDNVGYATVHFDDESQFANINDLDTLRALQA